MNKLSKAEKVEPASGWPLVAGDYEVGESKGCVAICTVASEKLYIGLSKTLGVAIAGPAKTENIGIEKIVANILSNPNIRFLILCGAEVTGHIMGGCLKALHAKGIDPKKKINGAPGAIPYLDHISSEGVEHFQKQITIVDMMPSEDVNAITAKAEELEKQDPGAYPEPPYLVVAEKKKEEAVAEVTVPLAPMVAPPIESLVSTVEDLRYKVQLIGRERRLGEALESTRGIGIALGLVSSLGILAGLFMLTLIAMG